MRAAKEALLAAADVSDDTAAPIPAAVRVSPHVRTITPFTLPPVLPPPSPPPPLRPPLLPAAAPAAAADRKVVDLSGGREATAAPAQMRRPISAVTAGGNTPLSPLSLRAASLRKSAPLEGGRGRDSPVAAGTTAWQEQRQSGSFR